MNDESEETRLKKQIDLTSANQASGPSSRPPSPSHDREITPTHPSQDLPSSLQTPPCPDPEIVPPLNPLDGGSQSKPKPGGVGRLSLFDKCHEKPSPVPDLATSSHPNGLLSPDSPRPLTRGFVVRDMKQHHDKANAIFTSTASDCDTTATTFGGDLLAPSLNQSPSISSRLARTASAIPLRFQRRSRDHRNDTTTSWDRSKHSFRLKCFLYLTCLSVPANVYIFYCFKHPPLPVCSTPTGRWESFEQNNGSRRPANGSLVVLPPTSISYLSSSLSPLPLHINGSTSSDLWMAQTEESSVSDPLCRIPETWEVLSLFETYDSQNQSEELETTAEAFGDPNASFVCYDDIASADRKLSNYRYWIEGVSLGIIGVVGLIGKCARSLTPDRIAELSGCLTLDLLVIYAKPISTFSSESEGGGGESFGCQGSPPTRVIIE